MLSHNHILTDGCPRLGRFYGRANQVPFGIIAAALRLGQKYSFNVMHDEALRRLRCCFPKDRTLLYRYCDVDSDIEPADIEENLSIRPVRLEDKDCIAVFHLARQLGLNELVPAALYRCANDVSIEELFAAAGRTKLGVDKLTLGELQDCMRAREFLSDETSAFRTVLSRLRPGADCARMEAHQKKSSCIVVTNILAAAAHEGKIMGRREALDPSHFWISNYAAHNNPQHVLCEPCSSSLTSIYKERQDGIWQRLGETFCST